MSSGPMEPKHEGGGRTPAAPKSRCMALEILLHSLSSCSVTCANPGDGSTWAALLHQRASPDLLFLKHVLAGPENVHGDALDGRNTFALHTHGHTHHTQIPHTYHTPLHTHGTCTLLPSTAAGRWGCRPERVPQALLAHQIFKATKGAQRKDGFHGGLGHARDRFHLLPPATLQGVGE